MFINMRQLFNKTSVVVMLLLIGVSFQNCSGGFQVDEAIQQSSSLQFCTDKDSGSVSCSTEIQNSLYAFRTRTCDVVKQEISESLCLVAECAPGFEQSGNSCVPIGLEEPAPVCAVGEISSVTIDCGDLIPNSTSAYRFGTCATDRLSFIYGSCFVDTCSAGYSPNSQNSFCVLDFVPTCDVGETTFRSCVAPNSSQANELGTCRADRTGFNYSGNCVPSAGSCISGYHLEGQICVIDSVCSAGETSSRSCVAPNSNQAYQSGTCRADGTGFDYAGSCVPAADSCVAGYHLEGQSCVIDAVVSGSGVTASIEASRLSGPAPLAVFFDSTSSSHENSGINTFSDIGYYFDFDDQSGGNWIISGESKNTETGAPLASHVFKTPGTYNVGVRAYDQNGNSSDAFVTITVTDPNITYSGSNTVCISTGSDFTGAPVGAVLLANQTRWPTFESNKRYLLKAGDNFTSFGSLRVSDITDFQVKSFGVGASPVVSSVGVWHAKVANMTVPERFVIQDLAMGSFSVERMANDFLVMGNTINSAGGNISYSGALAYYALNDLGTSRQNEWLLPDKVFIVENSINMNFTYVSGRNGIQGVGSRVAILGNTSINSDEHNMRIFSHYKSIVAHNFCNGDNNRGAKHCIKMHAIGVDPWTQSVVSGGVRTQPQSRYLKVAHNTIGSNRNTDPILLQLSPQDRGSSNTVEGLEDIVVEGNTFVNNPGSSQQAVWALGKNIVERGNVLNGLSVTGIRYGQSFGGGHPQYPNPAEWFGPYQFGAPVLTTQAPLRD